MASPPSRRCRGRSKWCGVGVLLKAGLLVLVVAYVKPLRNALLYPVWPELWRPIGSYKLVHMHVSDFFYPMNLQPYDGPCQDVADRIERLGILQKAAQLNATFRVHHPQVWDSAEAVLRTRLDSVTLGKLRYFRPALTETEQRALLTSLYVATAVLEAFNVTYFAAEGTLIGAMRHGGLIPWDDDADLLFRAEHWPVARRVLSCVPGFQLKIYSDFMWKFFSRRSPLWLGEETTRFPYVDIFPYAEDSEHVWPLVIWLKDIIMWPRQYVYPGQEVPFDNFRVRAPSDMAGIVERKFGDVMQQCASRLFVRRDKRLTTTEERVSVECRHLHDVYPFLEDHPTVQGSG